MIRFRLKELIADREFREKRVITIGEIADATGLNRATVSRIANQHDYNAGTQSLDRLCGYFGCRIEQLIEYTPDQ